MTEQSPDPAVPPLSAVEKLTKHHDPSSFDCGNASLNDWLKRFALVNQQADSARTYVVHRGMKVTGYYALAAGSVERDESPARIARGLASHPIGVVLLARLAVDRRERGTGLGSGLLEDALARSLEAAEIVGARAILVHAISEEVAAFYRKFGFESSPADAKQLMLLMKDLRASLRSRGAPRTP